MKSCHPATIAAHAPAERDDRGCVQIRARRGVTADVTRAAKTRGPDQITVTCLPGLGRDQQRTDRRPFQHLGIAGSTKIIGCHVNIVLHFEAATTDIRFQFNTGTLAIGRQ